MNVLIFPKCDIPVATLHLFNMFLVSNTYFHRKDGCKIISNALLGRGVHMSLVWIINMVVSHFEE